MNARMPDYLCTHPYGRTHSLARETELCLSADCPFLCVSRLRRTAVIPIDKIDFSFVVTEFHSDDEVTPHPPFPPYSASRMRN